MKRFAIILAAGKGTRMKSKVNKMLHPVMGQPMVNYSVEVATQAGAEEIISILGVDAEMVQDYLEIARNLLTKKSNLERPMLLCRQLTC